MAKAAKKTLNKAKPENTIAFQGFLGAYSHIACRARFPKMDVLPCASFEDAFLAVQKGRARLAMIPIDNSVAGRVADIHRLLPDSGLHIVGEHFERVNHHLLAAPGASLKTVKTVFSHVHALSQCRKFLRKRGLAQIIAADTAGSARDIAALNDRTVAAVASHLAGEIYGLKSLAAGIEDAPHNTTRFLVMARTPAHARPAPGTTYVTSLLFRVRNVPAALYKALTGFSTNGINMTKLESYMVDGHFFATQFYAEIDGHPKDPKMVYALEDLRFYSKQVTVLGVYPAHPFRETK
jgi:prephenate dehydratase